ncbi:hypothetical protein MHYP_G00019900 [Metynnis hypsauchen]
MDDLPVDWSDLAKAQDEDDALEPLRQMAKDAKAKEDRIHFSGMACCSGKCPGNNRGPLQRILSQPPDPEQMAYKTIQRQQDLIQQIRANVEKAQARHYSRRQKAKEFAKEIWSG